MLPSGVQGVQATAFLSAPEASVGTQGKISSSSWAVQPHKDFDHVPGRREKRSQLHNRCSDLSQKSFPVWLVSFTPSGSSGAQKSRTAFWTWWLEAVVGASPRGPRGYCTLAKEKEGGGVFLFDCSPHGVQRGRAPGQCPTASVLRFSISQAGEERRARAHGPLRCPLRNKRSKMQLEAGAEL